MTSTGPEPAKLHPAAAAELDGIERRGIRLQALALADQLAAIAVSETPCETAAAGLGLCEWCQLNADLLGFLYGIANGEHLA